MAARTPQAIRHAQRAFCQIPVQSCCFRRCRHDGPSPATPHRPGSFKPRPGVVIPFAARPVHRHAVVDSHTQTRADTDLRCPPPRSAARTHRIDGTAAAPAPLPGNGGKMRVTRCGVRCQLIVQPDAGRCRSPLISTERPWLRRRSGAGSYCCGHVFSRRRCGLNGSASKQPVHAVITADKPVALFAAPHCQPSPGL